MNLQRQIHDKKTQASASRLTFQLRSNIPVEHEQHIPVLDPNCFKTFGAIIKVSNFLYRCNIWEKNKEQS